MADEAFENVEICTTLKLGSLVAGQYLNTLTNLSRMKYLSLQINSMHVKISSTQLPIPNF